MAAHEKRSPIPWLPIFTGICAGWCIGVAVWMTFT